MNKLKKIIVCILVTMVFIVGCSSKQISEKEAIGLVNKLVDTSGFGGLCSLGGPLFCHLSFPLLWIPW